MIRELPRVLQELDELTSRCSRCGMCQSVCPVFRQTGHESDVARGKLALLAGLMDEVLGDSGRVLERVNRCLLCGSCEASCSRGVRTLDVFIRARMIVASFAGLSPFKKMILRQLLGRPRLFGKAMAFIAFAQRFFPRADASGEGVGREMVIPPFAAGRHLPAVSKVPFFQGRSARAGGDGAHGASASIAFFTGCVMNRVYPDIAEVSVQVLQQRGGCVSVSENEACCGIPALSAGDEEAFRRLVEQNLDQLAKQPCDFLVTACATCAFTIRELWPKMYAGGSEETRRLLEELSSKTMDITEYLARHTDAPEVLARMEKEGEGTAVTYHDPCHLKRSLGIWREPRQLIDASPGYRLVEMEAPDACCGGGGSFTLAHYDISRGIGGRKLEDMLSTGAGIVATSCPGCMMQLADLASRSGCDIQVKHVMEICGPALSS